MPNPFRSLRARQLLRVLSRLGYREVRRSGSHRQPAAADRLNRIAAEPDPDGRGASPAVAVGDGLPLTFRFVPSAAETRETVADLMRTQPIVAPLGTSVAV